MAGLNRASNCVIETQPRTFGRPPAAFRRDDTQPNGTPRPNIATLDSSDRAHKALDWYTTSGSARCSGRPE